MLIARSPFRVSFLGGGTDTRNWLDNGNCGAVIGTTINKYSYVICSHTNNFAKYRNKIVYSDTEITNSIDKVQHKVIRAAAQYTNVENIELLHVASLPSGMGLGSSSAFLTSLLHAFYKLGGKTPTQTELIKTSSYIEGQILKESIGFQDGILSAIGGFRYLHFKQRHLTVKTLKVSPHTLSTLEQSSILWYTGGSRNAHEVSSQYYPSLVKKTAEQSKMLNLVAEGGYALYNNDVKRFGQIVGKSWDIKRSLSDVVSNKLIDIIIKDGYSRGISGAKLLGAGASGCILMICDPKLKSGVEYALRQEYGIVPIPFKFETGGSKIIMYEN